MTPLFKGHHIEAIQGVPQHHARVEGQRHETPLAQPPPLLIASHSSEPAIQGCPD